MILFVFVCVFAPLCDLGEGQKTGQTDTLTDQMKNSMASLTNTFKEMQSNLTVSMDLQYRQLEKRVNKQVLNLTRQQLEIKTLELQNKKLLNRTVELAQQLLTEHRKNTSCCLAQSETRPIGQEMELSSLRKQLIETKSELNRTYSMQKDCKVEISALRVELELQSNKSLLMASEQASLHQRIEELNQSKPSLPEAESHKQNITTIGNQVNQTLGAYDIVINDVIEQLNTYRDEIEKTFGNITHEIRNLKHMSRYVSLSSLGTENRLSTLNFSLLALIHSIQEQQLRQNSSATLTLANIQQKVHTLETSLLTRTFSLYNVHRQLLNINSSSVHSTLKIQETLELLNSSIQARFQAVAFTVSLTSGLSDHLYKKILYDKVITNIGNGYDVQTGEFTCPQKGVYVFTWTTMSQQDTCDAFLYYNGVRLLSATSEEQNGRDHESATNAVVLFLNVGDNVWVQTGVCDYYSSYPYTAFSGWKL